jgi:hypothetical protein
MENCLSVGMLFLRVWEVLQKMRMASSMTLDIKEGKRFQRASDFLALALAGRIALSFKGSAPRVACSKGAMRAYRLVFKGMPKSHTRKVQDTVNVLNALLVGQVVILPAAIRRTEKFCGDFGEHLVNKYQPDCAEDDD